LAERAEVDAGTLAWCRATALLDGLTAAGLVHVVVSPGSRSTPLALAAARCAALRLHVVPDERSAAFFALGLARATSRPAALIATSGSAPAHWLPAAIEASEDGQPLLMLSADRPVELLGCGANQATEQAQLFAAHAREQFLLPADAGAAHALDVGRRAAAACLWPRPGPVHVNVAFREPLVPAIESACPRWSPAAARVRLPARVTPDLEALATWAARLAGRRGAVLVGRLAPGDPAGSAAVALARALDCALLADPLSGLRAGSDPAARVLCRGGAMARSGSPLPDWLIRVGAPPVSRALEEWAARCPDTLLLAATPGWADPLRGASSVVLGDPAASLAVLTAAATRAGLEAAEWRALDELDAAACEALTAPPREAELVEALSASLPAGVPVFVGNSLVVRDFDSFLGRRAAPLPLYANRGVSGIDGNVSTAAGISAATGAPVLAVIGDVALFHDLNGLSLCRDRPVVVVVINNGGGAIFGELAQAGLPEFESLWLTPPGLDLARAAALFELDHVRLGGDADLAAALAAALARGRPVLLELEVDRSASSAARRAWWQGLRVHQPEREETI
jgi:2-succinyl-5-enolpyruvyl-6-hydroxy-3-cyclohexene-1-carboxylate synthase